jgi:hypothetical protein
MTEDEKRQQKAELLLSYHEAEDDLAHLQEHAYTLSETAKKVSEWLKDHGSSANTYGSRIDAERLNQKMMTDPHIEAAMDIKDMRKVVEGVRAAREKLSILKQRKEALGLR